MAIAVPVNAGTDPTLKQRLKHAERINRWKAQALIAPLVLFLLLVFLVPIVALLFKSVGNPEVVGTMPRTVAAIASWDGRGLPAEPVYKAASEDLAEARKNQTLGDLSKRLNMELAGYRSLLTKTARALPFATEPASYKEALEGLDERWGDPAYWQVVRRNTSNITPYYLLAAVDHRIDDLGEVAPATPDQAIYLDIFARTFWMGLIITLICLVLGYPFAWFLAKLPQKVRPLLLFLLIVPFWTNSLIRIYGLKIFLSTKGYLNAFLLWLGVIDTPIRIMFTPGAVIIGLVYILLPFMVMPLYSSIEKLDKPLLEAARDLGASKLQTFIRIIIPLTMPGIIAGCLLVMLPAMGLFYVSDLMGGAKNLLIGNVIKSQFLNIRDWPFGSATSITLTVVMGLMLLVYWRASRLLNNKGELG